VRSFHFEQLGGAAGAEALQRVVGPGRASFLVGGGALQVVGLARCQRAELGLHSLERFLGELLVRRGRLDGQLALLDLLALQRDARLEAGEPLGGDACLPVEVLAALAGELARLPGRGGGDGRVALGPARLEGRRPLLQLVALGPQRGQRAVGRRLRVGLGLFVPVLPVLDVGVRRRNRLLHLLADGVRYGPAAPVAEHGGEQAVRVLRELPK
jgi:hypothetical protein